MAVFNALSIRDLVALVVISSRTVSEGIIDDPVRLVEKAFAVADQFVEKSEAQWAMSVRADRDRRGDGGEQQRKGNHKQHHRSPVQAQIQK